MALAEFAETVLSINHEENAKDFYRDLMPNSQVSVVDVPQVNLLFNKIFKKMILFIQKVTFKIIIFKLLGGVNISNGKTNTPTRFH